MRREFGLLVLLCAAAGAQDAWRREVMDLPDRPGANTSVADVDRLEMNARLAYPYFAGLTPGDYEANRALVRRMATYLATVEVLNRSPQMGLALGRAYRSVAALQWMMPMGGMGYGRAPAQPGPPPRTPPAPPPAPAFAMQAPDQTKVTAADRPTADDLATRYELAAGKAAVAWQAAGSLRRTLQAQGMSLNAMTETSLARVQVYFNLAEDALRAQDWVEARTNIDRAEYETEKVRKTVGR